jgi:hypothetical protein
MTRYKSPRRLIHIIRRMGSGRDWSISRRRRKRLLVGLVILIRSKSSWIVVVRRIRHCWRRRRRRRRQCHVAMGFGGAVGA